MNIGSPEMVSTHFAELTSHLRGPFSCIFYHKPSESLHFTRDRMGKKSLLIGIPNREDGAYPGLILCNAISEAVWKQNCSNQTTNWYEVPNTGVFRLDLAAKTCNVSKNQIYCLSWTTILQNLLHPTGPQKLSTLGELMVDLPLIAGILSNDTTSLDNDRTVCLEKPLAHFPSFHHLSPSQIIESFQKNSSMIDPNAPFVSILRSFFNNIGFEEIPEVSNAISQHHWDKMLHSAHGQFFLYLLRAVLVRTTLSTPLLAFPENHASNDMLNTTNNLPKLTHSTAPVAFLFSGGVDCTTLALLSHTTIPIDQEIDLINVAYVGSRSSPSCRIVCQEPVIVDTTSSDAPDRVASIQTYKQLQKMFPARKWRLILVNMTTEDIAEHRDTIMSRIYPASTVMDFNIGSILFFGARGIGIEYTCPEVASDFVTEPTNPNFLACHDLSSSTSGLRVASEENIQLVAQHREKARIEKENLRVAEKLRVEQLRKERSDAAALVRQNQNLLESPEDDLMQARIERKQIEKELKTNYTRFKSNLISKTAFEDQKKLLNEKLVQNPTYFAKIPSKPTISLEKKEIHQRKVNEVHILAKETHPTVTVLKSSAKVFILGSGADELLGGYGRHQTSVRLALRLFDQSNNSDQNNDDPETLATRKLVGQKALQKQLFKDTNRIWARNLGRDDRVMTYWGREARHPFLDDDFGAFIGRFLNQEELSTLLPSQIRMTTSDIATLGYPLFFSLDEVFNAELSPGIGDKMILRKVALALGLDTSGRLLKRAMQFGTKIVNKQLVGTQIMDSSVELKTILNQKV